MSSKEYYQANKEKIKEQRKEYYQANKEKIKEKIKEYQQANKEKIKEYKLKNKDKVLEYHKKYREENKDKRRESEKEYYQENKEKIKDRIKEYRKDNKETIKKWREKNREKLKKYHREHYHLKIKIDPIFRLKNVIRARIRDAIKFQSTFKSHKSFELLGCSPKEAHDYLESLFTEGMTWDNYGEWEIDHIRPCSSFDLTQESEQLLCFNYKNLQPLWWEDNASKSDKWG